MSDIGYSLVVEMVDDKSYDNSWNCMDFWRHFSNEEDKSWENFSSLYNAARSGTCPYSNVCSRHASSVLKVKASKRSIQLKFSF